jgi:hypothetical protein
LFRFKNRKCVENPHFEGIDVSHGEQDLGTALTPVLRAVTDCTMGATYTTCNAIVGPNGGPNACKYNFIKKKCVRGDLFLDNTIF